nr:NUDIX hydrolase [Ardenticatena sp.]
MKQLAWQDVLYPFWKYIPNTLRRWLIWLASGKFIVGVSAVCLNEENQVLLLEHRFHGRHPWGLPGGWLARGESPFTAILREVHEETGLNAIVEDVLYADGDGARIEIVLLCRVWGEAVRIQRSEILAYRWVDPAMPGVVLHPPQAYALATVAARLQGEPAPTYPVNAREATQRMHQLRAWWHGHVEANDDVR